MERLGSIKRSLEEDVSDVPNKVAKVAEAITLAAYGTKQGMRRTMEDHIVVDTTERLYAVFDGHSGDKAAAFAEEHFVAFWKDHEQEPDRTERLRKTLSQLESRFMDQVRGTTNISGTTAAAVHINDGVIYVAHLGDSRIVLQRSETAVDLTKDHKPNRPDEKKRIEELGGYLEFYGVWRVNGDLAVSRAIGDQHLKPFVSAEPEVSTYKIQPEDQCLILATDGLWDEISSQEAVNQVVESENYYSQALHSLLQDADSFQDNTSIILVNLVSDLVGDI